MAYSGINKSKSYFNTKLWTGTGSNGNAISGVGFAPDLVWVKNRSGTYDHVLFDRVRGDNKHVESNNNSAEENEAYTLAFGSDGYSVGTNTLNKSTNNIVGWNWKANGAGSANTDGSINSTVSVNQTAGFSIVKYTGTGANATVGHGLGVAPAMIIVKNTQNTYEWIIGHKDLNSNGTGFSTNYYFNGFNNSIRNQNASASWNSTNPTNSVFSLHSGATYMNQNGESNVAYCFAEKTGYSKFGYYIGNFNNNGTFVYTGFKPEFVIVKKRDATGNWRMFDSVRASNINPATKWMNADSNAAEGTDVQADLVSNGFKLRDAANAFNTDGQKYIYMAFGQSLVGSNNVPATAR